MIEYNPARPEHMEAIARLHALSWQVHYRGIFNDDYLDHQVIADRTAVWQRRFKHPTREQYIVLAQDEQSLCGFGCVYLNYHEQYGALLDNLHVLQDWQGRGIGKELMSHCCQWVLKQDAEAKLYLWVLKDNNSARVFYEKLGGVQAEEVIENNPGGGTSKIVRIVWENPSTLLN